MDRRKFLGRFGFGLGAAVLAPTIVEKVVSADNAHVATKETVSQNTRTITGVDAYWNNKGILGQIEERGNVFTYYTDRRGAEEFEKTLNQLLKEYWKT